MSDEAADRQAIAELIWRYCRAVDRLDEPLGRSIWHEDGTADYGAFYLGPGPGVIARICAQHRSLLAHSHQVSNMLIRIDGPSAASESYCHAALRLERDGRPMQIAVWSRYIDRWSRRSGRWGLDHRTAIRDFDEIREVTPLSADLRSRRDRDDPSYALFGPPA